MKLFVWLVQIWRYWSVLVSINGSLSPDRDQYELVSLRKLQCLIHVDYFALLLILFITYCWLFDCCIPMLLTFLVKYLIKQFIVLVFFKDHHWLFILWAVSIVNWCYTIANHAQLKVLSEIPSFETWTQQVMRILLYVLPIEALRSVIPNYWLAFLVVRSNCQECRSMVFPFNNLLFLGHLNYFVMPLQNLRSRPVAL